MQCEQVNARSFDAIHQLAPHKKTQLGSIKRAIFETSKIEVFKLLNSWIDMKTLVTTFLACLLSGCLLLNGASAQEEPNNENDHSPLVQMGNIRAKKIHESSGISVCTTIKDAIWTHNDSGNAAEVYLLSTTGDLLLTVKLKESSNVDWESMCRANFNGKPFLIIGDVGDNRSRRKSCQLYILPEPTSADKDEITIEPAKIDFVYEDGPKNCEAISFDSTSDKLWLIEKRYVDDKRKDHPGIYSLPIQFTPKKKIVRAKQLVAKRIGDFPVRNVTGMAFSPSGSSLIIRNYLNAHLYHRSGERSWIDTIKSVRPKKVALPIQLQGEAICFTPNGESVIVTSESTRQPIWKVNLNAQSK